VGGNETELWTELVGMSWQLAGEGGLGMKCGRSMKKLAEMSWQWAAQ